MAKMRSSYGQIFKSTSLFGGVQVFHIVISIVRSKLVAVLLGPAGMGINGLLTSTTSLIETLSNFGIGTSAVREIAESAQSDNKERLSRVSFIVQRLTWAAALVGALFTAAFSRQLSQITFDSYDYSLSFCILGLSIAFNQVASGRSALLRGLQRLKWMAKASLFGSFGGLLISIPLYYFYGDRGIVPAIVISSLISLGITTFYYNRAKLEVTYVPISEVVSEGRKILTLGFLLSMSSLASMGTSYVVRLFISKSGSIGDVGLYNAGFAIINSYVGMVFTAMGVDYFPRLTKLVNSSRDLNKAVNEQAEVALIILAPILCVFSIGIKWVVLLFYSNSFLPITGMMLWAANGMLFKAVSWAIGFIILSKGDSKMFFWTEMTANVYVLLFNLIGYAFWGLNGLGLAFALSYIVYFVQVFITCSKLYKFSISREVLSLLFIQTILVLACLVSVFYSEGFFRYGISCVLTLVSIGVSAYFLNKRIPLKLVLERGRGFFRR